MKPYGSRSEVPAAASSGSGRSAEYVVAAALIGVCVAVGGAAWFIQSGQEEPIAEPEQQVAAAPATAKRAAAPVAGTNWQQQLQKEIDKLEREQRDEQSRANADEERLRELQRQRAELEKQRRELTARAAGEPRPPGNAAAASSSADAAPTTATTAEPVRVLAKLIPNTCEQPQYPDVSSRMSHEGTVVLGFEVDPTGSVVGSRIDQSSGYDRLDRAASTALGKCRFTPGTVDGTPVRGWTKVRFVWKLS